MPRLNEKALNDARLRSLKPAAERYDVFDAGMRGLGLRVAPSGLKTWFAMRRAKGRMIRVSLGRYPEVPLAKARQLAAPVLASLSQGNVPVKADSLCFVEVMKSWLAGDQAKNRSRQDVERALKLHVLPYWRNRDITEIRRGDVSRVLDRIVGSGAAVQANRVLAYLRRMFNWCVSRDLIAMSPTAGIKAPTREKSRDRVLKLEELQSVWKVAQGMAYPFGPMLQLLIVTGQRLEEVAGAEWREIDRDGAIWNLPANRTKNGRPHVVHLSSSALEVLAALPRLNDCPFLFSTTGETPVSGFSKMKRRLDTASGLSGWTLHDLRRTFATILTESLSVSPVVVDRILNHVSGAVRGVAAVYQRGEYLADRKSAMTAYGSLVERLGGEQNGNIIELAKSATG
ncbi:tyrosine-type recombinase/integrase [Nordella sp. HKS 07]|uniref:tyrosine-type recombinase/integrase n=1 Tax=Nordella sp. HKS 07 TaxID=2712222 RepID=UPI0013E11A78|nr:site-specific integrase [Nordella sp. HKS 07]QIG51804.1 tyrosine-type recombinase/integrase [Nordella sp. HKS 07]